MSPQQTSHREVRGQLDIIQAMSVRPSVWLDGGNTIHRSVGCELIGAPQRMGGSEGYIGEIRAVFFFSCSVLVDYYVQYALTPSERRP